MKIYTLGLYGLNSDEFFGAVEMAQPAVFIDVRRRRGVRGSDYAFANSLRLQRELRIRGIRYEHMIELAPSVLARSLQTQDDASRGVKKRTRVGLSRTFRKMYEAECLAHSNLRMSFKEFTQENYSLILFCVERNPDSCHRSILAEQLGNDLNVLVEHLLP